jgi:hypothetical protein
LPELVTLNIKLLTNKMLILFVHVGNSPIDWCEENYVNLNFPNIAEFHNTITNSAYIIASIILIIKWTNNRDTGKGGFNIISSHGHIYMFYIINLLFTGITSAIFHGIYYIYHQLYFFQLHL